MINKLEYIKAKEILEGKSKPFYESKLLAEIIKAEFEIEILNFYLEEKDSELELVLIVKNKESYKKVFAEDERFNRKRDETIVKEFYKIMRDSSINLKYPISNDVTYYEFLLENN